MGTSLTGTTPQDTYDALIKVGDNGIITGSLKTLSDGEGHDTALALSTGAASVTGTLAVSSDVKLGTATTGTPSTNADDLVIDKGASESGITIMSTAAATLRFGDAANSSIGSIEYDHSADFMRFNTSNAEKFRITSAGSVQIGTSSGIDPRLFVFHNDATFAAIQVRQDGAAPIQVWQTNGGVEVLRATSVGLTFNGDTAAANALNDYEEGTWTMGVSFGGASVGVTTALNTGTYTKIGRQVSVNGYLELTSKGSSAGAARLTGLPFTIPNAAANYAAISLRFANVAFANQFQGFGQPNDTIIKLEEITEAGVVTAITDADFANNSDIIVNFTYFV